MQTRSPLPSVDAAIAATSDAVLLDVREQVEWSAGHAPAATHIPMSELTERVGELPTDRRIICVCRSGNRSSQVTAWLLAQGFDAVNMDGGMARWVSLGQPLVDAAGRPGQLF